MENYAIKFGRLSADCKYAGMLLQNISTAGIGEFDRKNLADAIKILEMRDNEIDSLSEPAIPSTPQDADQKGTL